MWSRETIEQFHPAHFGARIVRSLRFMSSVRGWGRLSSFLVPKSVSGPFVVKNRTGLFSGDLSSFIDRNIYLYGGYEQEQINSFVALIPPHRRRVVLDVGANVGTHSLAFARYFRAVHAFEPDPDVSDAWERNVSLNSLENAKLHRVGLSEREEIVPFYVVDGSKNFGLGTYSVDEQYGAPLRLRGNIQTVQGDAFFERAHIGAVDAIKIDVQGLELEVVRGLKHVIERNKPFIWLEIGSGSAKKLETRTKLLEMFPYAADVYRFNPEAKTIFQRIRLRPYKALQLKSGNYVIAPTKETEVLPKYEQD